MKNAIQLTHAINNAPVLRMLPEEPGYEEARQNLFEDAAEYFNTVGAIFRTPVEECGYEFAVAFDRCLANYVPAKGEFLPYLLNGVRYRVQSRHNEEAQRPEWSVSAYSIDDEGNLEALERLAYSSGDRDVLLGADNNPENWYLRRESRGEILRALDRHYAALRKNAKAVPAAFLTSAAFPLFGGEAGKKRLSAYSFFDEKVFDLCAEKGGSLSQRELSKVLGMAEGNFSRSLSRFVEELRTDKGLTTAA